MSKYMKSLIALTRLFQRMWFILINCMLVWCTKQFVITECPFLEQILFCSILIYRIKKYLYVHKSITKPKV